MQKFVEKIADHILESKIPLENWTIILPSERAKQYIQKALFQKLNKPFFSPKMLTINTWISQFSKRTVIDKTHLLLELYEIHRTFPSKEIDTSFDEFLNWGKMLMSDFDEIERYLVDSNLLFRNLKDIKEIENWSFNSTEELSENQRKYIEFWDRLASYFKQLQTNLSQKNTCMIGSVYRNVAENPTIYFQNENEHFLFAGFNALSKAEMTIFKNLIEAQKATVIFDSDVYYLNDNLHEAGYFIRKFRDFIQTKEIPFVSNDLAEDEKTVEIISCSQLTGQVKVAHTILLQIPENEFSDTLVLLADESLIIPLLNNIPKSVKKANITLGLPLKSTALISWIDLIFKIQEGFVRYNRFGIYYKDLLALWNHPFYNEILNEEEKKLVYEKESNIQRKNIIFQDFKNLSISKNSDEIIKTIFEPWENSWSKAMIQIRKLNEILYASFDQEKEENKLEKAIIQAFDTVNVDFQNCVNTSFPEMSLRSFKNLFYQEWTTENIAYYGNPIDGIQVMGLLETRLLDFKNLLVLGLNEGKMPPSNSINSLIPMDLRKFVGLPTMRDKQGLFAHHFYRLLHHAKNIYITYHNGVDSFAFAEKSRFVSQLEMELGKYNSQIKFINKDYTLLNQKAEAKVKKIEKTPEILAQLDYLFQEGISASMLKKYFNCPLDFYFQYVLKFGEEKKVEEELENNTFGSLIHKVLEELYEKFNQEKEDHASNISVQDIDEMLKIFESKLFENFKKHFNDDEKAFLSGKNFLSYSMSIEMCKQFLFSEKQIFIEKPKALLFIKALEMKVEKSLEIEIFGKIKKIKLKGFIDRVDEIDGKIRILDYKTGKVKQDEVSKKMKSDDDPVQFLFESSIKVKHFFQLYTYIYLFAETSGKIADSTGIISFVNFKNNPYLMSIPEISNSDLVKFYPIVLKLILEEIYNPETYFEHKSSALYCNYC